MADSKWISELTATTPLVDAARLSLALRLETVRDALGPALRAPDEDPEHVHQLRVATRRAGAALEIFALCLPDRIYTATRKQLRKLRRAAGGVRDWDVFLPILAERRQKKHHIHRAGLDFLAGYAAGQRATAKDQLREACSDYPFGMERLVADTVGAVHRPHYHPGAGTLLDLAAPMLLTLLKDLEQAAARNLDDYEQLHRVRILGKRLRYALEIFTGCFPEELREEVYPSIVEMQDILGRANDSHVASQRLGGFSEETRTILPDDWKRLRPGIEGLLRFHEERLPVEREQFLGWWKQWESNGGPRAFNLLMRGLATAPS
jgi:CHAD domain-containing protein